MYDIICLCLADGRLFGIGLSRVIELQRVLFASWAGRRVICLGRYTEDDDYPPSIQGYVKQELRRMQRIGADSDNGSDSDGDCEEQEDERQFPSRELYYLVRAHYGEFGYGHELRYQREDSDRYDALDPDEKKAYRSLGEPKYASADQEILCNLSKGEYVRNKALQELAAESDDEDKRRWIRKLSSVDLEHALLSRICWSTDPSISMSYDKDLHRGPWAGDRLEVTTMDKLTNDVEWKDISGEVVDVLREIWTTENTYT